MSNEFCDPKPLDPKGSIEQIKAKERADKWSKAEDRKLPEPAPVPAPAKKTRKKAADPTPAPKKPAKPKNDQGKAMETVQAPKKAEPVSDEITKNFLKIKWPQDRNGKVVKFRRNMKLYVESLGADAEQFELFKENVRIMLAWAELFHANEVEQAEATRALRLAEREAEKKQAAFKAALEKEDVVYCVANNQMGFDVYSDESMVKAMAHKIIDNSMPADVQPQYGLAMVLSDALGYPEHTVVNIRANGMTAKGSGMSIADLLEQFAPE